MNIRKEYRSPNCTLVLEGFGENNFDNFSSSQLLTMVINAECHFMGNNSKLQGGKVFLENLAQTVSNYAQQSLSGITHPVIGSAQGERITIEKIADSHLHLLTSYPSPESEQNTTIIELSTVQLFDLVDTVDQFLADNQALPEINPKIEPLSRRYRQADEPTLQKVLPAVVGTATLAITGFAIYLLPIPTVKKPEVNPQPTPNSRTVPPTAKEQKKAP